MHIVKYSCRKSQFFCSLVHLLYESSFRTADCFSKGCSALIGRRKQESCKQIMNGNFLSQFKVISADTGAVFRICFFHDSFRNLHLCVKRDFTFINCFLHKQISHQLCCGSQLCLHVFVGCIKNLAGFSVSYYCTVEEAEISILVQLIDINIERFLCINFQRSFSCQFCLQIKGKTQI